MRTFKLVREVDVSGVSGTGVVAEGVRFDNGLVAVAWLGPCPTVNTHMTIESVQQIHGHDGLTQIVWE
jgi:hypothetical protein